MRANKVLVFLAIWLVGGFNGDKVKVLTDFRKTVTL
jgi:hypothetical protein